MSCPLIPSFLITQFSPYYLLLCFYSFVVPLISFPLIFSLPHIFFSVVSLTVFWNVDFPNFSLIRTILQYFPSPIITSPHYLKCVPFDVTPRPSLPHSHLLSFPPSLHYLKCIPLQLSHSFSSLSRVYLATFPLHSHHLSSPSVSRLSSHQMFSLLAFFILPSLCYNT